MTAVTVTEDVFGQIKDDQGQIRAVKRYTWTNGNNVKVQVITYGGYITSIQVPDKNGKVEDVVIGFNTLEEYFQPGNAYFGSTVGRVANRIKNGQMTVESVKYKLAANDGPNHLHGGIKGFDKVVWESRVDNTKVTLSYLSKDLEEGYPGDVVVNVGFELTSENELVIEYWASTTKVTTINLTNHSYFNLAGENKGAMELYNHVFWINADRITEVDSTGIPTGKLPSVSGTVFDLRVPTKLGDVIQKVPNSPGYDHNFCITRWSTGCKRSNNSFVAKVTHPGSGRTMEVYSNQPGVQFYTGNFLPEDKSLKGKQSYIEKHGAFCLETQNFPDAINQPNFPSPLLHPAHRYYHSAVFKFFTEK